MVSKMHIAKTCLLPSAFRLEKGQVLLEFILVLQVLLYCSCLFVFPSPGTNWPSDNFCKYVLEEFTLYPCPGFECGGREASFHKNVGFPICVILVRPSGDCFVLV